MQRIYLGISVFLFSILSGCFSPIYDNQVFTDETVETKATFNPTLSKSASHKVLIGVIDSGIDVTHPLLKKHLHVVNGDLGWDFFGKDGNPHYRVWVPNPEKVFGPRENDQEPLTPEKASFGAEAFTGAFHGTHVSSIAVGATNGKGGDARIGILPYRVLFLSDAEAARFGIQPNDESKENATRIYQWFFTEVEDAIRKAHLAGATIINMSLGSSAKKGDLINKAMLKKLTYRLNQYIKKLDKVLIVVAAGNDSKDLGTGESYDAFCKFSAVLCVGSVISEKNPALSKDFTNYGQRYVSIFAPGSDIVAAIPERFRNYLAKEEGRNPANYPAGTGPMSGTSMASPAVAYIAARVKIECPKLGSVELKNLLINTAKKYSTTVSSNGNRKPSSEGNLTYQYRVANLANALAEAKRLCAP